MSGGGVMPEIIPLEPDPGNSGGGRLLCYMLVRSTQVKIII